MTAQHTPGPWVAVARTNAHIEIEAPTQLGYSAQKVASCSLTNHEANAHLIAAAPELLVALQEAENALADYIPTIERTGASLNYGHKVLRDVRAAIQKATNKEQA